MPVNLSLVCFFFQAEDGIRDLYVTGVQTCALPIWRRRVSRRRVSSMRARASRLFSRATRRRALTWWLIAGAMPTSDRKSTRLNSSHVEISYAVFCLKKKKKKKKKKKQKNKKKKNKR